jgi:thiosulfate/3-mercaptopyruvate sulfurtransferase
MAKCGAASAPPSLRVVGGLCIILSLLLPSTLEAQTRTLWDKFRRGPTRPAVYPEILVEADWLQEHLDQVRVVDAREEDRFARGHLPGAVSVPPEAWDGDPRHLADLLSRAGVPSEGTVICVSDRRDPAAAGRLFWMLELAGQRDSRVLNGGLEAWTAAGGELERGEPATAPAAFRAVPDTTRIADYAYVKGCFGTPRANVLDWRAAQVWADGHIPHSLPFPLGELVTDDGRVLSGRAMRPLFEQWGPRPRETVDLSAELIVCGDAPRGAVPVDPYFAARLAGIEHVRVYPEGFAGWRRHGDAPVVRLVGAEELKRDLHRAWNGALRDLPPPDLILFDLRGEREWRIGHIPGALNIPPHHFDRDLEGTVAAFWPGADRATIPVVFYCYGPGCTRSRNCSTIAARHGFQNLLWFKDGTAGWRGAGEELVRSR